MTGVAYSVTRFDTTVIGKRYGKLEAIGPSFWARTDVIRRMAVCRCDCGSVCVGNLNKLEGGTTKSCGCGKFSFSRHSVAERFLPDQSFKGRRFGKLVALGASFRMRICKSKRERMALFACDCGERLVLSVYAAIDGKQVSCGCHKDSQCGQSVSERPTYRSWYSMLNRCQNKDYIEWELYGGRGISVCERWQSFDAFMEDMGRRPDGKSIDRIDTNGNYEPGNCRWADDKTQARNRRSSRTSMVDGQRMTVAEMAEISGLDYKTVWQRIDNGWTPERAMMPVGEE